MSGYLVYDMVIIIIVAVIASCIIVTVVCGQRFCELKKTIAKLQRHCQDAANVDIIVSSVPRLPSSYCPDSHGCILAVVPWTMKAV